MLNSVQLTQVDLNLLVLFDVVVRERHVARAAARMGLSASAVSHGLGRLRGLLHDPLFLKTPKGVVPTARALELAEPVEEILARVRSVVATGEPFTPRTSTRRFAIGGSDGSTAVVLPPLLSAVRSAAPGVVITVSNLLPMMVPAALDAKEVDVVIAPLVDLPARFATRSLYTEEFVIAMRRGHPFAAAPTLDRYCALQHVVVSISGDPHGMVDGVLARRRRTRTVALTVPTFLLALGVVGETDLLAAVPRAMVTLYGGRFGVISRAAPFPLPSSAMCAIAPAVAMRDEGIAWLVGLIEANARPAAPRQPARRASPRRARRAPRA